MLTVAALILANVVVSLIGFRALRDPERAGNFLFAPALVARGQRLGAMFVSGFAHAGSMHLAFNMLSFFFFAPSVVQHAGQGELLLVYFASLLGADLVVLVLRAKDERYRALGASGAVSGVIFAAIVYNPMINVYFFFVPIPIPGPLFAFAYVALSIYLSRQGGGGVSHEAHAGGAIAGFVVAALLAPGGLHPLWQRVSGWLS